MKMEDKVQMDKKEAEAKYLDNSFNLKETMKGQTNRETVTQLAEKFAGFTLPSIFVEEYVQDGEELQHDYQSLGAQATVNLANKLMMALFKPTSPFFRMDLTQKQHQEVVAALGGDTAKVDEQLAQTERDAMKELDKRNSRVILMDAMLHLIITGNVLIEMPTEGALSMISLRDYAIWRDLKGDVVKIIFCEKKDLESLPVELQEKIDRDEKLKYNDDSEIEIFTCIQRINEDHFMVWQEMDSVAYCHRKVGHYTKNNLPWVPLTWRRARGKNYGTGLVEDYSGDFAVLSRLEQSLSQFDIAVTDIKTLVNPSGQTDVSEIAEKPAGSYVLGRAEDLATYSPDVKTEAQYIMGRVQHRERRLASAFLLNSLMTRDAERVTAEEVRQQAQELEGALGGVYSRIATELQIPLARFLLRSVDPTFADVEPIVVTGFEALSRGHDLNNFRAFTADLAAFAELPDEVKSKLDFKGVVSVLGAGHGVEYQKILLSEQAQKQKNANAAQTNAAAAGAEAQAVEAAKATVQ